MNFSTVNMLWLIWAVPVIFLVCFWGFRKRKKLLAAYSSAKGLSAICPTISTFRRWLKTMMLLTIILLMAVSLSGPQYGYSWKEIERRGVDLVIALDCSRSMLARDIEPSRLERAKREVLDLLGMIQGDRVGLVAFAGTAFLQCPLTLDYGGFNLFLGALNPEFLPVGGTDLAGAVATAVSAFGKEDATDKAIILITDGETTGDDPLSAARTAADTGIKIFAIGIGAADGAPIPAAEGGFVKDRDGNIVISKLDETTLKQLAAITAGAYVRSVAGDMDLDVIYQRHIRGTMETAALGEQKTKVFENRYQWILALALFLFFIELILPERKTVMVWILLTLAVTGPRPAAAADLKDALDQGQSAYAAGAYDQAVQHFVAAQLEAPEKNEIFYDLGNAQYKSEDYDSAVQAYGQALASEDVTLKQKAHYNMGNAFFRRGDLDKAIENYEAALALDDADHQARENLDFVKELKANPPQNDPQNQQDQQDQNEKQDEGENQQAGEQGEKSPDQRDQENQGDDNSSRGETPEPSPSPDPNAPTDSSDQDASQNTPAEQKETSAPGEEALRQAEKMLNRLQDQPGRAMIPAYRDRRVEKDW